jgi:hypothetical protein
MVYHRTSQHALLLSATLGLASAVAIPEPTAVPAKVEVRAPVVTSAAIRFDSQHSYLQKKDIIDDIKSGVDGAFHSAESVFGTALPSFFTEGKQMHKAKLCTSGACMLTLFFLRHPRLVRRPSHR